MLCNSRFFFLLIVSVYAMNCVEANDSKDQGDNKNLRILELLPNLSCPLAVDPAVPANFIALTPSGILNPYDWIYWGPKDVLNDFFENPSSLKEPILRVKLSPNTIQIGPNSLSNEKFLEMRRDHSKGCTFTKAQWGNYPLIVVQDRIENNAIFMAFVGLNDPEAGWTLMFNLQYPGDEPNERDCQLWEKIITKTTQLKDGDYFKACGQDLQEGYTIVSLGGAKLKMLAEKRESDGELQVVVIPESADTDFHYVGMEECLMGATWKYGEPMVKVFGEITVHNKASEFKINQVTSIFFKTVAEFSYKKEEGKKLLIFSKKSNNLESCD